jgi:hypothetical protein
MNPRNAAEVALGVAGVWLIVSRMPELGLSLVFTPRQPDGSFSWIVLLLIGLVILCGLGLVLLRHRIASWLVPMPQPDLSGSVAGIQAVAFSVVGVFLLAHGFAGLLAQLAMLVSDTWGSSVERLATPLAQVAVGLALFLGARRLATIWQSLRTAGRPTGDRDGGAAQQAHAADGRHD